ncbi:MAG TPA: hypothetical protein VF528_05480 [Pyrinomonadaceae bacterium]
MLHERPAALSSATRRTRLFLLFVAALLCCTQPTLAQSGRNRKERTARPAPVVVEPQTETAVEPQITQAPVAITSVIVAGDIVHDSDYFRSNYVDIAVKACINRFKEGPMLNAVKGGKLKRKEAIAWAKKETAAYVLWLEIRVVDINMWGDDAIPYIKYFVFKPQTAELLTEGQVEPGNQNVRLNGARIPTVRQRRISASFELEIGGQKVADQVRRKLHY